MESHQHEELPILEANVPTLQLFLSVSTQWTLSATGHVLGLNYSAVDVDINRSRVEVTPTMWAGLKAMEQAARHEMNKQR